MIRAVAWSEDAGRVLLPALGDDLPEIRGEVESGMAGLYFISEAEAEGYFVLRLETLTTGASELVIVAGAGRGWRDAMRSILVRVGRSVDSVRIHTKREGIKRWARGLGFMPTDEGPEILRLNYGQ